MCSAVDIVFTIFEDSVHMLALIHRAEELKSEDRHYQTIA